MALITAGSIATGAGIVWKYWRVPVRLWQWRIAKEVEPAAGQLWREAGLSGPNRDWKVVSVREDPWHIFLKSPTTKDSFGDYEETNMDLETWLHVYIKKRRLYCKDTNESVEDRYFGEHSED